MTGKSESLPMMIPTSDAGLPFFLIVPRQLDLLVVRIAARFVALLGLELLGFGAFGAVLHGRAGWPVGVRPATVFLVLRERGDQVRRPVPAVGLELLEQRRHLGRVVRAAVHVPELAPGLDLVLLVPMQ